MELQVKEETGFSAIEMVLYLVIFTLITFVGFFVYNSQKSASATYAAVSKTAITTPAKVSKTPTITSATGGYLVIKEWNVKLKLPNAISDADYSFTNGNRPKYSSDVIFLGTAMMTKLSSRCAPTDIGLGALDRQTIATHDKNVSLEAKGKASYETHIDTFKVGNFYYGYAHSQSGCYDPTNKAVDTYYMSTRPDQQLQAAVETLQPIN